MEAHKAMCGRGEVLCVYVCVVRESPEGEGGGACSLVHKMLACGCGASLLMVPQHPPFILLRRPCHKG